MIARTVRLWWAVCLAVLAATPSSAQTSPMNTARAQAQGSGSIIRHVGGDAERLKMIQSSTRMLTLEKRFKEAVIDNPEIADLVPRGANQLMILAKKQGFTVITLKDEDGELHSIALHVTGDARELASLIGEKFPNSKIVVTPLNQKVLLEGMVDDPEAANRMVNISKEFFPDVINHISVGGVRQVLLQVRVMEVSRSKLRSMGFDFARTLGDDFLVQSVSGLITSFADGAVTSAASDTFTFGLISNNSSFFGVMEALRQNNLARVLAEPELVTVSGRPASFNVGGEFPIPVPQSLGTISIEFKRFGTQVDFVPIVLANGAIRLEVRPRISEIDNTRGVTINNITIPGLRTREVDTGVEMRTGQTLAIAGLVQTRQEAETKGVPYLMDVPYLGAAFRRVQNVDNEIELLITVTPHLVEPLDCDEVPKMGPGLHSGPPRDCELFFKSYLETPNCTLPDSGAVPVLPGQGGWEGHEGPWEGSEPHQQAPEQVLPPPGASSRAYPATRQDASRQMTSRPDRAPSGTRASTPQPTTTSSQTTAPRSTVQRIGPAGGSPTRSNNRQNRQSPATSSQIPPVQGTPGFLGDTGYDVRK